MYYLLQPYWFKSCIFVSIVLTAIVAMVITDAFSLPGTTDGAELPIRGDAAKPVLPPYATPPSRLYRPGQKSAAAECDTFQELWDWLAGSDKESKYPYRCEFLSTDPVYRGVALSRYAQSWENVCNEFVANEKNWAAMLRPEIYQEVKREAQGLLPHLKVLNGAGLPSKAVGSGGTAMGPRLGYVDKAAWREPTEVGAAIDYLLHWMSTSEKSTLKATIFVASASGLTYDSMINHLVLKAYHDYGGGKDKLKDDAVARLCQGGGVKRKREAADYTHVFGRTVGLG